MTEPFQREVKKMIKETLNNAKLKENQITDIIISGGSSRIPCIKTILQDTFPGKLLINTYQTDETLVEGAGKWSSLSRYQGILK